METSSSSTKLEVPSSSKDKSPRSSSRKDKESASPRKSTPNPDIGLLLSKQTDIVHIKDVTECPIEFVTVYSDRAEITRRVNVQVENEGVQKISVQGFPANANEKSFRMSGGAGHATIFEVGYEKKTITTPPQDPTESMLSRLEDIPADIELLTTRLQCLAEEKVWLTDMSTNKKHISEDNKMGLEEVANYLKFFSDNMNRLNMETHQTKAKIKELEKERASITAQIDKMSKVHSYDRRDFMITFYSPGNTKLTLQITYLVTGVSFVPSYDVRVNIDPTAPLACQLMYYAEVSNNSSEDWCNVKMSISTAKPALSSVPPSLGTRYLRFQGEKRIKHRDYSSAEKMHAGAGLSRKQARDVEEDYSDDFAELPQVAIITSTVEQSTLGTVTFHVPQPCTVMSDKKPHKVCIAIIDIDIKITHEAVPSRASHVFMRANGVNASAYLLLPGAMNVFLNGIHLTSSSLNLTNPDEKIQFYVGVDESIKLDIKPIEVVAGKTGLIKKSRHENTKRAITVKNTKQTPISIQITEQLPLSQDEALKVKLHEPEIRPEDPLVVLNALNNIVWTCEIGAGKEKSFSYHYSIEYPADKIVVG